jgi:ABC-type multidrug transport system ATPase subunit
MTAPNRGTEEVVVRAQGLAKSFRGGPLWRPVVAVADATFEVRRGEVFALVGPNGAGKSSTLRMFAGLVFPTSGVAEVCGAAPAVAVSRGQIGYLSDRPSFYDHLAPETILDLAGLLSDMPSAARRRRTGELMERLGLASARGSSLGRLSAGTRQRVALALALLAAPPVLLLDEPLSDLDPMVHRAARALFAELRATGTTVVMSTHVLGDVEAICDRVAIMVAGRVRRLDTPGGLCGDARGITVVLKEGDAGASSVDLPAGADVDAFVRTALDRGASLVSVTPRLESLEDVVAREVAQAEASEDGP